MEIILSVRRDIDELLQRFADTNSLRYRCFCQVWNNVQFSLIFSGKPKKILFEFTEQVMQYLVSLLTHDFPIQHRVGALYAIYGCYKFQPCHPKAKARFNATDLSAFQLLNAQLRKYDHSDALFVISYLQSHSAFLVTALPSQVEYGSWVLKANIERAVIESEETPQYQFHLYTREMVGTCERIQRFADLEQEYNHLKRTNDGQPLLLLLPDNHVDSITPPGAPPPTCIITGSSSDLSGRIRSRTEEFVASIKHSLDMDAGSDDEDDDNDDEEEEEEDNDNCGDGGTVNYDHEQPPPPPPPPSPSPSPSPSPLLMLQPFITSPSTPAPLTLHPSIASSFPPASSPTVPREYLTPSEESDHHSDVDFFI